MPDAAPPPLARPPRDRRLDAARGALQLTIFASHAEGSVLSHWPLYKAWGLSDASEQFVLLSGLALGSVFALKRARDGLGAATRDLLRRAARLWRAHLAVFAGMALLVLLADAGPLPGEAARLDWGWLRDAPAAALAAGALTLYQPYQTGILPVFLWSMLALPAFLWAAERVGAWALLPLLALWAASLAAGPLLPSLGGNGVAFDPAAWAALFLFGALLGRRALLSGAHEAVGRRPALVALAWAVLALGLLARLAEYGWLPGVPPLDATPLLHKTSLSPARAAHALALAYLVAVHVPRDPAWLRNGAGRALEAVGRHSLPVFCVGLFLSWGVGAALRLWPEGVAALDVALVALGAALLVAFARALDARRTAAPAGPVTAAGDPPRTVRTGTP